MCQKTNKSQLDLVIQDLVILIQTLKSKIAANAVATWTGLNTYAEINISDQNNECIDTKNSTETNENATNKWHVKRNPRSVVNMIYTNGMVNSMISRI